MIRRTKQFLVRDSKERQAGCFNGRPCYVAGPGNTFSGDDAQTLSLSKSWGKGGNRESYVGIS